jgi:hypothetical protein
MASDLDQALSNAIASGVSAPVDLITWLLRKGGLPIDKPVGGSDWMREKGLTKDVAPGGAQVVGETVGSLVDPLSSLGAGAKGAMLVGVPVTDAARSKLFELLRKGATQNEAWQDTGRAIAPRHTSRLPIDLSDPALKVVREISDAGLRTKPGMTFTPTEKEELIKKLPSIQQQGARLRANVTDMFIPGKYKLDDLIEHPEFFRSVPGVANLKVTVDPTEDLLGEYSPTSRAIRLGVKSFLTNPTAGATSSLMHELTHDQQMLYGMPLGANVRSMTMTGPERDALHAWYEDYNKSSKVDPRLLEDMYITTALRNNPYALYKAIAGEQQARAVQKRLQMPDNVRKEMGPNMSYDDTKELVDSGAVQEILYRLRQTMPIAGSP